MSIHIGKIISDYLEEKRISRPTFARMIGKHPDGIFRLFLRQHLHTTLLLKISQQLNHNFFQYYVTDIQQENRQLTENKKLITDLQQQTSQLQKENERLQTETNLLKEMFVMMKGGGK